MRGRERQMLRGVQRSPREEEEGRLDLGSVAGDPAESAPRPLRTGPPPTVGPGRVA